MISRHRINTARPSPSHQAGSGPGTETRYNRIPRMKDRDQKRTTGKPIEPSASISAAPAEKSAFPWRVAGGGGLALLLIWFVLQNSHSVQVNLFWWSGNFPMIFLMAAVSVAAILVWEALALLRRRRRKRARAQQ